MQFQLRYSFARSSKPFSRWTAAFGRPSFRRTCPIVVRLRFWSRRGRARKFSTFTLIVAETACVSSRTLSLCFPEVAISLFPFNPDRLPFSSAFRRCSRQGSFVSGLNRISSTVTRILSEGTSWVDNSTSSHLVSNPWTSSPRKITLDRSEKSRIAS